MLRITKQTDYSIVLLSQMCKEKDVWTTTELSEVTSIPLPMVQKILKLMSKGEMVQSIRGTGGGYHLSRRPSEISVVEIIEASEGPIAITECISDLEGCGCKQIEICPVSGSWGLINLELRKVLSSITLEKMYSQKQTSLPRTSLLEVSPLQEKTYQCQPKESCGCVHCFEITSP